MTDTATISGPIQYTGRSFPIAPRDRPASGEAEAASSSRRHTPAAPAAAPGGSAHTPLLSGGTQIAAQDAPQASQEGRDEPDQSSGKPAGSDPSNPENLSEEEKKKVQELQKNDREVRAHEAAHKAAGGPHAGSPTFKTVKGPDGKSYAVSGEVKIDTSPVPNNPEATIQKLEQVKRAALAPSNPSSQDRHVAAEAESKIQKARQEKRDEEAEEIKKANEKTGSQASSADPSAPARSDNPLSANPLAARKQAGPAQPAGGTQTLSPGSLFNLVA